MNNWNNVKFSSLYAIPSKNGLTKPSRIRGSGYKMINMGELFANDRIYDIPMELVPLSESEKITSKVEKNDLLFARQSLIVSGAGKCSIVLEVSPLTVFESHIIRVRLNEKIANPLFYYYYFKSTLSPIKKIVQHCVQAGIKASDLAELTVINPPIEIQNKIVEVLSCYDEKIELNNQSTKLLEELLSANYKKTFLINPTWNEVELSKIISFQEGPGIRNWQYVEKDGIKFINIRCINNNEINTSTANMISKEEADTIYSHFMLNEYDIVMSCSGTLGRYAIVRKDHLPLCLNTSVIRFMPKNTFEDFSYIYSYLTSKEFLNKQKELACGSVQANFGPTHLKKMKMPEPPEALRKQYHANNFPIIQRICQNLKENKCLVELRDILLGKLMTGNILISNEVK